MNFKESPGLFLPKYLTQPPLFYPDLQSAQQGMVFKQGFQTYIFLEILLANNSFEYTTLLHCGMY